MHRVTCVGATCFCKRTIRVSNYIVCLSEYIRTILKICTYACLVPYIVICVMRRINKIYLFNLTGSLTSDL